MKKDSLKQTAKSVRKAKPLAKGADLKSAKESEKLKATTPRPSLVRRGMGRFGVSKNENPNRGAVAPPPPQPLLTKEGKGVVNGRSGGVFRRGRVRVFNFKRWHKLSAAFVSIAIIGIVVFFQFAPENARSKTFTFFQTAWSSIAGTVIYSL